MLHVTLLIISKGVYSGEFFMGIISDASADKIVEFAVGKTVNGLAYSRFLKFNRN